MPSPAPSMNAFVDVTKLEGFAHALANAPKPLLKNLAKAYRDVGRFDIETLRARLPGKLNVRAKGLSNSFKFKATDPNRASDFTKLFTSEYTGWKAASIFQTGGTIVGKGKQLTVLLDGARGANGRRKYTQKQLRALIASGKARFVPTPHGVLIVEDKGGLTKTGKGRKGSRSILLAILKKSITQTKRLDFYENFEANAAMHQDQLETAIENTLVEIATKDAPGGD